MANPEVIICGASVFGLTASLLLSERGIKTVVVDDSPLLGEALNTGLQVFWPSPNDPPTRAIVAHGIEMAQYLTRFCRQGVELFEQKIIPSISQGALLDFGQNVKSLRYAMADFESVELKKAVDAELLAKDTKIDSRFPELTDGYIITQPQVYRDAFIHRLKSMGVEFLQSKITEIEEGEKGCRVKLSSGEMLSSELVVLSGSYRIAEILPQYSTVLVPMSDVTTCFAGEAEPGALSQPLALRTSNGHIGAAIYQRGRDIVVRASGPRYLLPQAGVGINFLAKKDILLNKHLESVKRFLEQKLFPILANEIGFKESERILEKFQLRHTSSVVSVDTLPCDELPLVGEFGRLGRIHGSAGWLATGYSAGCQAAKIVCDIILTGKSSDLHPRLAPRRLNWTE